MIENVRCNNCKSVLFELKNNIEFINLNYNENLNCCNVCGGNKKNG